jgi:CRP-like cAMP-binding protein
MVSSSVHARVQGPGPAWRMDSAVFRRELADAPALRDCVGRYIFVAMTQLARDGACGRFHAVFQRVARRLLMCADRAHAPTFHITHEALANALGVRRVSVTGAARLLGKRGLIRYSRGEVTVLDRAGLGRAACSCYRDDLRDYRRYLG